MIDNRLRKNAAAFSKAIHECLLSSVGLLMVNVAVMLSVFYSTSAFADDPVQSERLPTKLPSTLLPNLVQIHQDVYSGGQPGGEAAFDELQAMGVKTIISVDGVTPDIRNAESHQMRYVHLPHGYDGIPDSRVLEIAKAVRDLPKPIYIHCHLGRHRSPAAASAACVTAGLIQSIDARVVLETAGTGKNYVGLFETVERAKFDPARDWSLISCDFQSIASIPPIARSMVSIEHYLSRIQKANQSASTLKAVGRETTDHDLLMLRELYVELTRDERAIKDNRFSNLLTDGIAMIDLVSTRGKESIKSLEQNCKDCHQLYRDVPTVRTQ